MFVQRQTHVSYDLLMTPNKLLHVPHFPHVDRGEVANECMYSEPQLECSFLRSKGRVNLTTVCERFFAISLKCVWISLWAYPALQINR